MNLEGFSWKLMKRNARAESGHVRRTLPGTRQPVHRQVQHEGEEEEYACQGESAEANANRVRSRRGSYRSVLCRYR